MSRSKMTAPPLKAKTEAAVAAAAADSSSEKCRDLDDMGMMTEFQDVLDLFQRKGRSTTKEELGCALRSLGYYPTEEELQELIEGVLETGPEADAPIDMSYFLELMAKRMKDEDSGAKLKEAFRKFDKDQNGYISALELGNAMKNMGENLSDKDVDRMIRLADVDGDGQVDYEEFVNMMMAR